MVNLIAFPFQLSTTGEVATVQDGTDTYYAQELASLCMTLVGERELVPDYGIQEPTFDNFDEAELVAKVDMFGPPVRITDIDVSDVSDSTQEIQIGFELSTTVENAPSFDDFEDATYNDQGFGFDEFS